MLKSSSVLAGVGLILAGCSSPTPPRVDWNEYVNRAKIRHDQAMSASHDALKERITCHIMHDPVIGASGDELKKSCWGDPIDVHVTVVSGHTHEQWIYAEAYPNVFVYVDNGLITGYQRTN